ncbi:PIN domain-containing protein [Candidatus Daviesbacteria bacterium]|nr:PIN domain-containing protein [Candidatus Daviesbacteria bacterium]
MVILDTNIIIDHLRQHASRDSLLSKLLHTVKLDEIAISMITIQELFAGQSTKDEEILKQILAILAPFRVLPYTWEVARMAGEIDRDQKRPVSFADVAIAATAIINGARFFTLDKKDFQNIKDLELF